MSVACNYIREIIPQTSEMIKSLDYLDLRNNRTEHLEINVFAGLVKLKHTDLEGNKLKYVHPDTFLGLHNLIYLCSVSRGFRFNLNVILLTETL